MDSLSDDPTRNRVKRARWSLEDFRLTVERLNNPDLLPDPRDTDDLVALVDLADQEDLLEPLLNRPRYSLDFSLPDALLRDESLMGRWSRLYAELLRTSSATFDEAVRLEAVLGYYEKTFDLLADAMIAVEKAEGSQDVFDVLSGLEFTLVLARPPYAPARLRSQLSVLEHESWDTVQRVIKRIESRIYSIVDRHWPGTARPDRRERFEALQHEYRLKFGKTLPAKAVYVAARVSQDVWERYLAGKRVRKQDDLDKRLYGSLDELIAFVKTENPRGL